MNDKYDHYLSSDGPAALAIRQPLMPVEGRDAVLFPPTYASGDGFKGGYNIDIDENAPEGERKRNVCLVDSVGSQANRIEPIFMESPYSELVPQIVVIAGEKKINLLEAGHRAGDAIVRCSEMQETLHDAFKNLLGGDPIPLAKIAPTSFVFGVWDSRDTQAKMPRLVASCIRAFDVRQLTRSAQYFPATKYVSEELIPDHGGDKKKRDQFAERGYVEVPATATHGGVIADGGVRRDATLALAAARLIKIKNDDEATRKLQRYILGLALVAFTVPFENYLRQGCLLVEDDGKETDFIEVHRNGKRENVDISSDEAMQFAEAAAADFGVGPDIEVPFDSKKAEADLKKKEKVGE